MEGWRDGEKEGWEDGGMKGCSLCERLLPPGVPSLQGQPGMSGDTGQGPATPGRGRHGPPLSLIASFPETPTNKPSQADTSEQNLFLPPQNTFF